MKHPSGNPSPFLSLKLVFVLFFILKRTCFERRIAMGTKVLQPQDILKPAPALGSPWKKEGTAKPVNGRSGEVKRQEEAVAYAGTAFSMSPSPRSLPVPKFFSKRDEGEEVIDYLATRDLRRILGLD